MHPFFLFVVLSLGFVHVFTVATRPSKLTGWGNFRATDLCLREAYLESHSYHGLPLGFFFSSTLLGNYQESSRLGQDHFFQII